MLRFSIIKGIYSRPEVHFLSAQCRAENAKKIGQWLDLGYSHLSSGCDLGRKPFAFPRSAF